MLMSESREVRARRGSGLLHQLLRGSVLGLALISTVLAALIIVGVWALLSGYRAVGTQGTSMEPALRDGDALWIKYLDPSEVRVGDIVARQPSGEEAIGHRVVMVVPLSGGAYLVVTKGDANRDAEQWEIGPREKVGVALVRVRYLGHVLGFVTTIPGKGLTFGIIFALAVPLAVTLQMARRRRRAPVMARFARSHSAEGIPEPALGDSPG